VEGRRKREENGISPVATEAKSRFTQKITAKPVKIEC
jgi:hypothetical protein